MILILSTEKTKNSIIMIETHYYFERIQRPGWVNIYLNVCKLQIIWTIII